MLHKKLYIHIYLHETDTILLKRSISDVSLRPKHVFTAVGVYNSKQLLSISLL